MAYNLSYRLETDHRRDLHDVVRLTTRKRMGLTYTILLTSALIPSLYPVCSISLEMVKG